ncbi:MAG: hypothetical protein IKA76_06455 [Clostridia bacterium]|nr:hypothetical protein [Clostridia bacterium]
MLKGIQKNMIWVRTPESRFFEAAYFVMRPTLTQGKPREGEMLREANRLLSEGAQSRSFPKQGTRLGRLLLFLAGMGIGGALTLLLTLILVL